eukprot:CAMPEP_0184287860 /NCGR_PEP_ID=MMETSP1049-20130417/271_1 /TAXON_ID=77928 /ORGANISM="Proteomonas sulcata, Strain CCMP704" /LENGTH=249 /DNA_ID=CAMNT_0026593953 /DNA_START=39 /DNA_END=788 /DNA_ORIENTATION=-
MLRESLFTLLVVLLVSPSASYLLGAQPLSLRGSPKALSPSAPQRVRFVSPRCQVIFDANDGWKPEHHGQGNSGNVDTPDFFEDEDGNVQGPGGADLGFQTGAAATGGGAESKLSQMLGAEKTEVRQVERQSYDGVEFKPHPWRIDGDFNMDPSYDLAFNTATGGAAAEVVIEPNSMTFEDFVAGFSPESAPGWVVEPSSGTLDRRGGTPTRFTVTYKGDGNDKGEKLGDLVVVLPNDNFSYTYKLRCTV